MRLITVSMFALVLTLTSCSATPPADPALSLLGGVANPAPEAIVTPDDGSWDDVTIAPGLTIVVLLHGDDPTDVAIADGVLEWSSAHDAGAEVRHARDRDALEVLVEDAVGEAPDLIIGAGAGVVDLFALVTSQHLSQQFLIVGAQLAEPTENVTAVIWNGSEFRGSGISDPDAVAEGIPTGSRINDGVAAGVAAVVLGHPGIVLNLDG